MRNLKKFLALVLAMLMVVSAGAAVSAFEDVDAENQYAAAIELLSSEEYGIIMGKTATKFAPDDLVTRWQMALFFGRALEPEVTEDEWKAGLAGIFADVKEQHYLGAINWAALEGIIKGTGTDADGNNLFKPENKITYGQALIMVLRALGYEVDDTGNPYWLAAYAQAQKLGLTDNVSVASGDAALTRAETAQIIYNMIKATPADGGKTIEQKLLGEDKSNATTFVISATVKQSYEDGAALGTVAPTKIGLQQLVKGLPTGEYVYIDAADLGLTAETAELYFGYPVNIIDYKADAIEHKVEWAANPVIVDNSAISKFDKDDSKIKFAGKTYYFANEITGTDLFNELVILAGNGTVAEKAPKYDANGNIVRIENGQEVVKAFLVTGDTFIKASDSTQMTREQAIAEFGYDVDEAVEYKTLDAKAIDAHSQIIFFDDDTNGTFDRAIVKEVYMSAYLADKDGKAQFGKMIGNAVKYYGMSTDALLAEGAVVTDLYTANPSLAAGDIVKYVYDKAAGTVVILDKAVKYENAVLSGRIDLTKNNSEGKYAVTVTLNDTPYNLVNANRATGAEKVTNGNGDNTIKTLTEKGQFDYRAPSSLISGSKYDFYAFGNEIVFMANAAGTPAATKVYTNVVVKNYASYDFDALYVDAYINGKLVEDVAITKINGTEIAKLSMFDLNTFVFAASTKAALAEGNVLKCEKVGDGYQVSAITTPAGDKAGLGLTAVDVYGTVKFASGVADVYNGNIYVEGAKQLRTDANTLWYFIDTTAGAGKFVTIQTGTPSKDQWIDLTKATVLADKVGFGTDTNKNGVATVVYVYGDKDVAYNVFATVAAPSTTKTLFVTTNTSDNYLAVGSSLGFTADNMKNVVYRVYNNDKLAYNMADGTPITTLYVPNSGTLTTGYYEVEANGVVKAAATNVKNGDVAKADFQKHTFYAPVADAYGTIIPMQKISSVTLISNDGKVYTDNFGHDDIKGLTNLSIGYVPVGDKATSIVIVFASETFKIEGIEAGQTLTVNGVPYTADANDYNIELDKGIKGITATYSGDKAVTVSGNTIKVG